MKLILILLILIILTDITWIKQIYFEKWIKKEIKKILNKSKIYEKNEWMNIWKMNEKNMENILI